MSTIECANCNTRFIPVPLSAQPPARSIPQSGAFTAQALADDYVDHWPSGGGSAFVDYLVFRRMIVPILIQVLFWLGFAGVLIGGLIMMFTSTTRILGIAMVLLGPIIVRMYCELMIVFFRINETLTDIRSELRRKVKQ